MLLASIAGDLGTIRAFEAVSVMLYGAALVWLLRLRHPLYLGAFIGGTLVFAFDWHWTTNGFFQATFNEHLVPIPGIGIGGQHEPLAIPLNYGFGFGLPAVLYAMKHKWMEQRFGRWKVPAIWLGGAIGVGIYEIPVVHLLGIWTYHQRPSFEVLGFPWSNFWFGANLIAGSCVGVAYMARWAQIPEWAGFSLRDETTWKGLVMGATPVLVAFYLTGLLQLWWYSAAQPWITPSPRPF